MYIFADIIYTSPFFSFSLTILTPPQSTYRRRRRHHHRHPPVTTTTSLQHSSVVSRTRADGWRLWYSQICTKMKCYFTQTVTLRLNHSTQSLHNTTHPTPYQIKKIAN
ncbi:hypothetical protein HanRHA438_Chr08g0346461 [Helianthus annuus]|uniref:Uncharacterized protein n=1 Tax=Helianthus annuus TaxID=4232 RepID=A0A9K3NCC5_HELAN|nr:hypothetical protein HanXRQr2_Chr08g0335061 [Helianthus annuus]KAJ0897504.1 hypothetical protein HanRHA438_Chr08g0346461 [Helianthus annuus]